MPAPSNGQLLTPKEGKWVKKYMESGNGTEAALEVYDVKSKANAESISKQLKKKPRIQLALRKAFEDEGITPAYIANKLKSIIDEGAGVKATSRDANTSMKLWGEFTDAFGKVESETTYKKTLRELPTGELVKELEVRQVVSSSLLSELQDLK